MTYLIIVLIASFMKAIADNLAKGKEVNIFKGLKSTYFRPTKISWKRKYKEDLKTPAFLFATTLLVSFTDAWHKANLIMYISLFSLLLLPPLTYVEVGFLFALFLVLFEGFYRILGSTNSFKSSDLIVLSIFFFLIGAVGLNNSFFDESLVWIISLSAGGLSFLSIGIYGFIHLFINEKK